MLHNPNGLAYAAMALLGVDVFLGLLGAGVQLWTLFDPVGAHGAGVFADFNIAVLSTAAGGVYLATAVVFIIWFHRVRKNADVWALDIHRRTPGWAIGAWFIPIANLWIPRQIAVDVWRASRPDPYAADGTREMALLNSWWAVWLAGEVTDRVAGRMYKGATTPDAWFTAAGWALTSYLLIVAAGVLAILFVRRLTSMQHTKATGMLSAAK